MRGYEIIVRIAADVWLQRHEAIDALVEEATQGIAAIPEIDRSYVKYVQAFNIWNTEAQLIE